MTPAFETECNLAQAVGFQRSFPLGGAYPNLAMGTIALIKQTFMEDDWYIRAWGAYEAGGWSFFLPETSEALGTVYGVTRPAQVDPRSTWHIASDKERGFEAELRLEGPLNRLTGSIDIAGPDGASLDLASASVVTETGCLKVRFDGEELGYKGVALLAGSVQGKEFYGWTSLPNGADPSFQGTRTKAFEGATHGTVAMNVPEIDLPFIRPMMEYGVSSIPEQPDAVIVRNATIWTQGPQGQMENADLLICAGRVVLVGTDLDAPRGAVEINGTGKHVTPDLIDPHIHSGVSEVNKSGIAAQGIGCGTFRAKVKITIKIESN